MYVDQRVAHAHAKLVLNERAVDPRQLDASVYRIVAAALLPRAGMMDGRRFRRQIEATIAPALRKAGFAVRCGNDDEGQYGFFASITMADAVHGLRGVAYLLGGAIG